MNRALLFLAAVVLLFNSCKKDHSASTSPLGKKYKVAFDVTNFARERASFSATKHTLSVRHTTMAVGDTVGLEPYLDVLFYYVFDSNGHLVHHAMQDSTFCDQFGIINDSLQNGTYTIIISAGKTGLQESNGGAGTTIAQSYVTYGGIDWQDTFFKRFSITVTGSDVKQAVVINRIVTKIELKILDAIPQNANTIVLKVFPEFPEFEFDGIPVGPPDSLITNINIPASAKGKAGFAYDKILGNQLALFDISILCKDGSGHIIGSGHAGNVASPPNQKTILSGNLFDNTSTGQTFTVKVDTAWGGSTTISF